MTPELITAISSGVIAVLAERRVGGAAAQHDGKREHPRRSPDFAPGCRGAGDAAQAYRDRAR